MGNVECKMKVCCGGGERPAFLHGEALDGVCFVRVRCEDSVALFGG